MKTKNKRIIITLLAVALVLSMSVLASAFTTADYGYIDGTSVNLRSGAGTSYASLGLLNVSDIVQSTGNASKNANGYQWDNIKVYSVGSKTSSSMVNKTGWTANNYINWICSGC